MSDATERPREYEARRRRGLRSRRVDYDNVIDSWDDDSEQIERPLGRSGKGPEATKSFGLARRQQRSSSAGFEIKRNSLAAERAGRTRCPDRRDSPANARRQPTHSGQEAAGDEHLNDKKRARPEMRRLEDLTKYPAQDRSSATSRMQRSGTWLKIFGLAESPTRSRTCPRTAPASLPARS